MSLAGKVGAGARTGNQASVTRMLRMCLQDRTRGHLTCICCSPMSPCGCVRARVRNEWDETVERYKEKTSRDLRGKRDDSARAVVDALRWAFLSRIAFALFEGDGGQQCHSA